MKTMMLLMVTLILVTAPMTAASDGLTTLQAGANEIRFKHNGRTRRLIITTPRPSIPNSYIPYYFAFTVPAAKPTAKARGGVRKRKSGG